MGFLLTRPLRDVTGDDYKRITGDEISTHMSLAGRDTLLTLNTTDAMLFLLTRPLRDVTA